MHADKQRFGPFEFDPASGELRKLGHDGPESVERLAPQPARLLDLLVERQGALVSREEIRREIWPDVEVDFDASLHFCIRQIRAALGDQADNPLYIENLPRRGYRIITAPAGADPVETATVAAAPLVTPDGSRSSLASRWRAGAAIVAVLTLLGLVAWAVVGRQAPGAAGAARRIGILPFDPPEADESWGNPGPIAEQLLEQLMRRAGDRAEIIGPTTTAAYAASSTRIRDLADDYRLDYVINGRFIHDETGYRMLAELIRTEDGAHVWVRPYTELSRQAAIALEVTEAVLTELESPRGERF